MKVYIANTTKQQNEFAYRIAGRSDKFYSVLIRAGSQALLPQDDLTTDEFDSILAQHRGDTHEYIVSAKNVHSERGFKGLIYQFNDPVPQELIEICLNSNDAVLSANADKLRQIQLAASAVQISDEAAQSGVTNLALDAVSIVQDGGEGNATDGKFEQVAKIENTKGKGK